MYNDIKLHDPLQIASPGTYTTIAFGDDKRSAVSVGYRFNDRKGLKCLYNKFLGKDRFIFIDWTKEVIKLQNLFPDAYIAGDFNTELPARRADDQKVAQQLDDAFSDAGYTNLVSRSTFSKPNTKSSQIDFIFSKKVNVPPVNYITINQAPMFTDGHVGLMFEAGASPKPPEYEPCKVYKDHTRDEGKVHFAVSRAFFVCYTSGFFFYTLFTLYTFFSFFLFSASA